MATQVQQIIVKIPIVKITSLLRFENSIAIINAPISNDDAITPATAIHTPRAFQNRIQSICYTHGLGKKPNIQWIKCMASNIQMMVTAFSTPSASSKFLVMP